MSSSPTLPLLLPLCCCIDVVVLSGRSVKSTRLILVFCRGLATLSMRYCALRWSALREMRMNVSEVSASAVSAVSAVSIVSAVSAISCRVWAMTLAHVSACIAASSRFLKVRFFRKRVFGGERLCSGRG